MGASITLSTAFIEKTDITNPIYTAAAVKTGIPQYLPSYNGSTSVFGNVELTDDYGRTYATPAVGVKKVDATEQVKVRAGVFQVVVTLNEIDAGKLAAIPSAERTATTVQLTATGNAKLIANGTVDPAASSSGASKPFENTAGWTKTLSISNDGATVTLGGTAGTLADTDSTAGDDAYQWTFTAYYALAPKYDAAANATETGIDSDTTDHAADKIQTIITKGQ